MTTRVLIVDDERLARVGLRRELEKFPGIEIVAECASGPAAVDAILAHAPDLVLLDVQMPGLTGFGVIEAVGLEAMPAVIFVTAYDRHALRAFEVHALDYLLKPVDPDRLRDALDRAMRQLERPRAAVAGRLEALLDSTGQPARRPPLERLSVREAGRIRFVEVESVDWIEAAGNYVRLHQGGEAHLVRATMDRLAERLGPGRFVRIRRSVLVNARAIRSLEPYAKGSFTIRLRGGASLVSSRHYGRQLREWLEATR